MFAQDSVVEPSNWDQTFGDEIFVGQHFAAVFRPSEHDVVS